jgi:hypothetical protein
VNTGAQAPDRVGGVASSVRRRGTRWRLRSSSGDSTAVLVVSNFDRASVPGLMASSHPLELWRSLPDLLSTVCFTTYARWQPGATQPPMTCVTPSLAMTFCQVLCASGASNLQIRKYPALRGTLPPPGNARRVRGVDAGGRAESVWSAKKA